LYDETFTRIGANGQLEEYWCSTGERIVIPPEYFYPQYYSLDCMPTALVMAFSIPGPTPIFIRSYPFGYHDKINWLKLFCDF
jgi:hypothetical protein